MHPQPKHRFRRRCHFFALSCCSIAQCRFYRLIASLSTVYLYTLTHRHTLQNRRVFHSKFYKIPSKRHTVGDAPYTFGTYYKFSLSFSLRALQYFFRRTSYWQFLHNLAVSTAINNILENMFLIYTHTQPNRKLRCAMAGGWERACTSCLFGSPFTNSCLHYIGVSVYGV